MGQNNINENFLTEDLAEIDEDGEQAIANEMNEVTDPLINTEVITRIEKAKLYEAMLRHPFFSPDSAREEIIESVEKEFREFVVHRLEVLLGIKKPNERVTPSVQQPLPFSAQQVEALKRLADRVLDGAKKPSQPTVNTVSVRSPVISTVNSKVSSKKTAPAPAPAKKTAPAPRRQKTDNLNTQTGQDYSQAVSVVIPPLKMPSQMEMDQMNAIQAGKNASGAGQADGSAKLMEVAINISQRKNANIKEE